MEVDKPEPSPHAMDEDPQEEEDDEEESLPFMPARRGSGLIHQHQHQHPQQAPAEAEAADEGGGGGGGGGGWSDSDESSAGERDGGLASFERRTEALVRQLLQRAEAELYDYDPALDKDEEEQGSTAAEKEGEEEDEDEEAKFRAHMKAQQQQAAAQAEAQARAFRREWSATNGLCHLRVVGRRILPPSTTPAGPGDVAEEAADAAQVRQQGRRRRVAVGPGWEWQAPVSRHHHRMGGDDDDGALSAASSDAEGAEHPSGTARGYFGAPLPAVVGRGARVWGRESLDRMVQEEEEEVFASHGREGTELLAVDQRPSSPSTLPDPGLLALIDKQQQQSQRAGAEEGEDDADPAVVIARELAATLAAQVWADLKAMVHRDRVEGDGVKGGGGMPRSRGSSKRLMGTVGGDDGGLSEVGAGAEGVEAAEGVAKTKYMRK